LHAFDPEDWLDPDSKLDDVVPLGTEEFAVPRVNRAVNKVSEKREYRSS
jgi:hypothetical protein